MAINHLKGNNMKTKLLSTDLPSVSSENQIHLERYVKFINSRPERKLRQKGFHTHHIYPRSMAEKNSIPDFNGDWNLIELTLREHFIAHLILRKCGYKSMISAFSLFRIVDNVFYKNMNSRFFERWRSSSEYLKILNDKKKKTYNKKSIEEKEDIKRKKSLTMLSKTENEKELIQQKIKITKSKLTKEQKENSVLKWRNTITNKTEEAKLKEHINRVNAVSGEKNGFFGKHHTTEIREQLRAPHRKENLSEETLKRMSKSHLGHKDSDETRYKKSINHRGSKNGKSVSIFCIELNKVFESITEVINFTSVSKHLIYKSIRTGKPEKGLTFVRIMKNKELQDKQMLVEGMTIQDLQNIFNGKA
jgi:hypothetical protein